MNKKNERYKPGDHVIFYKPKLFTFDEAKKWKGQILSIDGHRARIQRENGIISDISIFSCYLKKENEK